jgi:hypothetical protein
MSENSRWFFCSEFSPVLDQSTGQIQAIENTPSTWCFFQLPQNGKVCTFIFIQRNVNLLVEVHYTFTQREGTFAKAKPELPADLLSEEPRKIKFCYANPACQKMRLQGEESHRSTMVI